MGEQFAMPLPVVTTDVSTVYGPWESSSRPGLKHYTFELQSGALKCTCEGYKYRQDCKHTKMIQERNAEDDFDISV